MWSEVVEAAKLSQMGFDPAAPSLYRLVQTSHGRGIDQSEERPAGAGACVNRLTLLSDIPV